MEDDTRVYFGDDFGQKIDLTVRIREILRNYPEGTSIFKELVQNADDAGATEVTFCLDLRQHPSDKLAYKKMEVFQGPSLLVHNNAIFSDADFRSIQRIGDSLKKDTSKGWKTGRFGVGFNSVYHLTDLPAFVSGSHLVFFDPQACHLPNVNPSNPGKMINFVSHPEFVATYPGQIEPFRVFGCDFSRPFDGTVFRLALRTEEQATGSRLSNRPQAPDHMMEMMEEFAESIHLVLLFLRNVGRIKVMKWEQGQSEPSLLCDASISNMTEELQAKRSLKTSMVNERQNFDLQGHICDFLVEIAITRSCEKPADLVRYFVANQLGGGECSRIANDPMNASQRLVPWGGIAARIPSDDPSHEDELGLAFCFLPLPTHTYLPVHVNGYFELSSNRRDIWFGEGLSGDGLLRAQWNEALLQHVVAPCYARTALLLKDRRLVQPELHSGLFPCAVPPAPWDLLSQAFFNLVRAEPCLFCTVNGGTWVRPTEALILRRTTEAYDEFVSLLLQDGIPLVTTLTEDMENVMVKSRAIPRYLEPSTLRALYKIMTSKHAGNRDAIKMLLAFMTRDLNKSTVFELIGVNLLPLSDDSLSTFQQSCGQENVSALEHLCSMGFSRADARRAVRKTGGHDVEAALNWLVSGANNQSTSPSGGHTSGEGMTFFLPTEEERRIFCLAQAQLIDVNALPEHLSRLLCLTEAHQQLNLRNIDMEGFEELLSAVLPSEWFGKASISWTPEDSYYEDFNEEWFRLLWRYLGPSSQLRNLQDKWPLLPTESGLVCVLNPAAGVVSAELLPPGCLSALTKLGIPVLLKNLFATVQPHVDVWSYVHQPTSGGVLSCLTKLCSAPELDVKTRFYSITLTEREQLRAFLLADMFEEELTAAQKVVFSKLPIFEGVIPADRLVEFDIMWKPKDDSQQDDSLFAEHAPALVGLHSSSTGAPRAMCPGIKWDMLDENFLHVQEHDRALVTALRRVGVHVVPTTKFFADHLIPRLQTDTMSMELRILFICDLLREMSVLLSRDHEGELSQLIEAAPIFPALSGELKRIVDLFDPDIDEFSKIMDDSFFPALELQDPQPLSVLRSLGLQRHLSRRSLLALACSMENDQSKLQQEAHSAREREERTGALKERATEFFKYVDAHVDQLITVSTQKQQTPAAKKNIKMKSMKLWRTLVGDGNGNGGRQDTRQNFLASEQAEEMERKAIEQHEIDDFVAKMNVISWVPVSHEKPHPSFPWYKGDADVVVASPESVRLSKDRGLCSSERYILENSMSSSPTLRQLFKWHEPVPVEIVAKQLRAIAVNFKDDTPNSARSQVLWPIMYEVYSTLSRFFESEANQEKRTAVLALLSSDLTYIMVSGRFVAPHRVALSTRVNAEPYLFAVPGELVHFRPFLKAIGVRERFSLIDYVDALAVMHAKSQLPLPSAENGDGLPLSQDEVVAAIGLVQLISDTLSHHGDYELYAPDANGVLTRTVHLTYDDAPWLSKGDIDLVSLRFIHPKISNEVAMKIGAKSLRTILLHANQPESLLFSTGGDIEAFGQTEALTKRISHILEQYPDGPHIISELIQNADDAGATRVRLMYSDHTFGSSSLLSPAMAKWQGPALYAYNDAEFQDSDFISLARIGQGAKLQKVNTTGRFGLGFNSVYHFTDLPAVVSADSLVMFDPHATHLPGISPANPGIKVRFVNSTLPTQFPDQFEPFKIFGCDMKNHFHGSLFRFPLRHDALAGASEIKQRAYTKREIFGLFESFRESISDAMIFLRNVRTVEVMIQGKDGAPPVLLYSAEVPETDRGDSWRQIDRFISGGSDASTRQTTTTSKRAFYSRLARTAAEDLPSVTQIMSVYTCEHVDVASILDARRLVDEEISANSDANQVMTRKDEFLVCNQIGGGRAREMACAPENESLKLIPWVGIAGRLVEGSSVVDGRAFCFLPLPVRTGLPVHINGYFELSSNRRDIWHGDDLTGDGKLRSEWNARLLTDAIAPAYATFLVEAKRLCIERNSPSTYLTLLPAKLPAAPWVDLVRALFAIVRDKPVLTTSSSALHNVEKPINPAACVLVDESVHDWQVLEAALNTVNLDTVRVPTPLRLLLTELNAVYGTFTPAFFRKLVQVGRLLPALDVTKTTKVIQFCLSDARDPSARAELNALPIVPTLDCSYKPLLIYDVVPVDPVDYASTLFFASDLEAQLLGEFLDHLVDYQYKSIFDEIPNLTAMSNLFAMEFKAFSKWFLPRILPADWVKSSNTRDVVSWEPGIQAHHPSQDWLRLWWEYVDTSLVENPGRDFEGAVEDALRRWPFIPVVVTNDDSQHVLIRLGDNSRMALIPTPEYPFSMETMVILPNVLTKLGVAMIDASVLKGTRAVSWLVQHSLSYKLNLDGFLSALSNRLVREQRGVDNADSVASLFAGLDDEEMKTLEQFVSSGNLCDVSDENLVLLRKLPIFPVYSGEINFSGEIQVAEARKQYRSIDSGSVVPGDDANSLVLNSTFFIAPSGSLTRALLRDAQVDEWPYTKILLDHVFPRLHEWEIHGRRQTILDSVVRDALMDLPFHQRQDSRFRETIKSLEIIPSTKRVLRRVSDLYDPNNRDLGALVGPNSLPHESFSTSEMVDVLRSLGLRSSLSCHAILESARSVEAMVAEAETVASIREDAWNKAQSLLKVVNRSFDEMALVFVQPTNAIDGESPTTHANDTLEEIVSSLRTTKWLPVHADPLKPLMPWRRGTEGAKKFASAETTRPENDAWMCSLTCDILNGQLRSEVLVAGFGWDSSIDFTTVASQLAAIGDSFVGSERSISSPEVKHLLQETQRMYTLLDDACTSGEEDDLLVVGQICQALGSSRWVWTGGDFVGLQQVAAEVTAELEPLLFAAPPDVLVPRSLLTVCGLKQHFTPVDYLLALRSLSEETDGAVTESKTATCVKLLELVACAVRDGGEEVTEYATNNDFQLLDEHGHLVPARELVVDDMEWDESSKVRRGWRFVNKRVSAEVALALGAKSLHSTFAETSVTSTPCSCPSAESLTKILPKRNRWFEGFFTEMLLAAERLGGSQVDFFIDYRKHPSQRVIHPSFQVLQDEAICVHIHGLVLTTNDVNRFYRGEISRAGFLAGFVFADCLQILSGNGFYVLDPASSFLPSTQVTNSGSSKGSARRYDILTEDFMRYPDQLLPFCTLPSCPGNIGSNGPQSTLLRFPWRKTGSAFSDYTLSAKVAGKFVEYVQQQLAECLVFTESIYRVSLTSVGQGSEYAVHAHGEATVENAENTLQRRNATRQNNEWKKKFSLQSFFRQAIVPENQMEFIIKLEIENKKVRDTWLISDNIGAGRSRDLASTPVHEVLQSTPFVSVACRLFREGIVIKPIKGKLYKLVETIQEIGLPIHVTGCFKKHLSDNSVSFDPNTKSGMNDEQAITAHWNRVLLEDGVVEAYWKLLHLAKRKCENTVPKAFYGLWPTKIQASNALALQVQSFLYRKIGAEDFFLCTDGTFRSLNAGYVVDLAGMDLQVVSFAQLHFPSFDLPTAIIDDAQRLLSSRVFSLSPRVLRKFLRNVRSSDIGTSMCLSLLEYCLSDLTFPLPGETHSVWSEFQQLPLLPLEDGSIGLLGTNQRGRYVLGSFNQIQLLAPLAHTFVSLEARQRLHAFFSDSRFVTQMGLSNFSIKTLSDNIHLVLPSSWKDSVLIDWKPSVEPGHVSQEWMYRFWNEVRFERRSLAYFTRWPLIPVQGSRLLSCGKPDAAVCIWDRSMDRNLREHVSGLAVEAARANDEKLAALDRERKHLKELATQKRTRAEEDVSPDVLDAEDGERVDLVLGDSVEDEETKESEDGVATEQQVAATPDENVIGDDVDTPVEDGQAHEDGDDRTPLPNGIIHDLGVPAAENEVMNAAAVIVDPLVVEATEFCTREVLHNLLAQLNLPLLELAYLEGQEVEIIPSSRDVAIAVLDGICASEASILKWSDLSPADATLLAEYFSDHGQRHGGFNRMHIDRLKWLPLYVNICGVPCGLNDREHFLVPDAIDLTAIPLPQSAKERFLQANPRLTAFYRELGVTEMSYPKLLLFLLPSYAQLLPDQCDSILALIKQHWQTLRGDAPLVTVLRGTPLFRSADGSYHCASAFLDPRNTALKTIFAGVDASFPCEPFQSSTEWLDLMGEIGLRSEITVELFIECARRLEAMYASKSSLSTQDEAVINVLHGYFVQNFDKYDRSRVFFEQISTIQFVPATRYANAVVGRGSDGTSASLTMQTVLVTYAECATPDDQSLVFSTMPVLTTAALPSRVLWSRLGLQSPPPKTAVLQHLYHMVNQAGAGSIDESWHFFVPVAEVFQQVFKYLQDHWDQLTQEERSRLTNSAIVPVGSSLVKGNRLFFHLAENLAPLMYEVPRVFGAYDRLFRHIGSKDSPEGEDYVALLRELAGECGDHPLNLNELYSVTQIVSLLSDGLAEQTKTLAVDALQYLYLPTSESVMRQAIQMAHNDAPWICARVDLTELQVVHPRLSPSRCDILGVKGISQVVSEELEFNEFGGSQQQPPREIQQMNELLTSQQFGNGLRTIISVQQQKTSVGTDRVLADFDDLHRRIVDLGSYQVRSVDTLRSRFIATLGHPPRRVNVTKASAATGSVSFVDTRFKVIYVAVKTLEATRGVRLTQVVASCLNQLLGGFVQDGSAIESILSCDLSAIPPLLRFLNIQEDPELIAEKLRGTYGELLCERDLQGVELSPLRLFYVGELVAIDHDGGLRYAKILTEKRSAMGGINQFEVRVRQAETKWYPSTQIYSFKPSRGHQRSSQDQSQDFVDRLALHTNSASAGNQEMATTPSQLPSSVVASRMDGAALVDSPAAVPPLTVVSAVNDLLSKLNLSLNSTYEEIIAENIRLQKRFEQAEEGRRMATAQVEEAVRKEKDAQESLICAICLENKVDRVLIPCGHIYCSGCVAQLPRQTCPICRQTISATSLFHVPS